MVFPFRSRTLGVLIRWLDAVYTDREIGTMLLDTEADRWDPRKYANKQVRLQGLFRAMREDGSDEASTAALEIARRLLRDRREGRPDWMAPPTNFWEEAVKAVEADGWEYDNDNGRLVSAVPGVVVAEETSFVEQALTELGWTDAAGHYRQALEAFSRAEWAGSNAQLRSLLDDLLPRIAETVTDNRLQEPRAAIDQLKNKGWLIEGEYNLLRGSWELAQHRGSHPGLSDQDEARFRLILVTSHCRFLITRLGRH